MIRPRLSCSIPVRFTSQRTIFRRSKHDTIEIKQVNIVFLTWKNAFNFEHKFQSYSDEDLKLIVGALPLDQRQKMEKLLRDKRRNSEFKILLDPKNRKDVPSWVSPKTKTKREKIREILILDFRKDVESCSSTISSRLSALDFSIIY